MNRRSLTAAAIITAPGLALAACAISPGTTATVEQFIATTQSVLAYASPIVTMVGIFVPGAAAFVPLVQKGLSDAASIFDTVSSTMTVAAAQPKAQQIGTALNGAMTVAGQAIDLIPDPAQKAKAQVVLAQVQAGVNAVVAFSAGTVVVPAPTAGPIAPPPLFVRRVA